MYDRLANLLVLFIIFLLLSTILEAAVYSGAISWSWDHMWIVWAFDRMLNCIVVVIVCFIWRPSPTSQLYAYSSQLPTDECDDEMEIEMTSCVGEGEDDVEVEVVLEGEEDGGSDNDETFESL